MRVGDIANYEKDGVPYTVNIIKVNEDEGTAHIYLVDKTGGTTLKVLKHRLRVIYSPILTNPLPVASDTSKESETTAKPSRYSQGSLEVWDAINQLNFNYMQGAVVKYISRYKHKNGAQDLKKAINYLVKMLAEETKQDYYELRKKSIDEVTSD
jgi:hypothetical protein